MRDGVRIVNAARGALVDEDALARGARSGKVAGAALDVFVEEPYSGPLLELDNVVVTPHLAASTEEAQDRAGVIVAEQVAAALEGGLVSNAVNIPVDRRGRPRGARRRTCRSRRSSAASRWSSPAAAPSEIVLDVLRRARASTTRACSPSRRSTVRSRAAPTSRSTTSTRRVIAAERGMEVREEQRARRATTRTWSASSARDGRRVRVAGTTIGSDNRPWLVSVLGFEIEMELAPLFVLCRYDDVPGVIGRVGTLFGEAGVNIANMTVSRTARRQGADGAERSTRRRRRSSSSGSEPRASTTPT